MLTASDDNGATMQGNCLSRLIGVASAEQIYAGVSWLKPGSYNIRKEHLISPDAACAKYEDVDTPHAVNYERQENHFASNIFELRAWKAKRALEVLQVQFLESWHAFEVAAAISVCLSLRIATCCKPSPVLRHAFQLLPAHGYL